MAKDGNRDYTTPFGEAMWATLDREEAIAGKPTGKCSIKLVLTGPALDAIKAEVEDFITETFPAKKAKGVTRPFKEKDGKVYIVASTFAFEKGTTKLKRVPLFDSKGNPVRSTVAIGNGSIIRLKTTLQATEYQGKDFMKFWLNGVQIRKLEAYTPGGAFEADEEDGGFVGDEFDADQHDSAPAPDDREQDGADF